MATAVLGLVFVGFALLAVPLPGDVDLAAALLAVVVGPTVALVRVPRWRRRAR